MRECPNCGHLDSPYWRPRIFDFEVDFCQMADLEIIMPDLAKSLKEAKPGSTFDEGIYTYKRTKSNYVWRMWLPLFKLRGWAPKKYYDSAGSARTAAHKSAFYYARIKRIVSEKNHRAQTKLEIPLHFSLSEKGLKAEVLVAKSESRSQAQER